MLRPVRHAIRRSPLLALLIMSAAALLAACGDGEPSPTPSAAPTTAAITPSAAVQDFYLAAATGAKATTLSTISDGGAATTVARGLGGAIARIAWSPDGRLLACTAGSWLRPRLWLVDPATRAVSEVRLTAPAVKAVGSIAWLSADELLVAGFTVPPQDTSEVAELLIYNVTTRAVTRLSGSDGLPLRGVMPSASADGAKVAFVTYTNVRRKSGFVEGTERLKLLDRSTGSVTELGTGKAYFDVNARRFDEPLISPDGNAIIFRSARSDVGTSCTVMDAAGTILMKERELLFPAGYAWDPTGQKVVFAGRALDATGMNDPVVFYVFDRGSGGAAGAIARFRKMAIQDLAWSPDGTTIAFAAWDPETYETGTVYLMPATGGDADELVANALTPAWQPHPGRTPAAP